MSLKQLYPLHLFFSDCYGKAHRGSSGADEGQFHHEKLCQLHLFFFQGQLRDRHGAASSGKSYIQLHQFFFDYYGKARGLLGVLGGFSLTTMGKLGSSQGFSGALEASQGFSGAAQAHVGAVFSRKSYFYGIYFSLIIGGINRPFDQE